MVAAGSRGVVAAGHASTAQAAADALRDGGTAIDAAIAAMAMSCLSEPVLSSPGGGGFAMIRTGPTEPVSLIDFFPQTPLRRGQVGGGGVREVHADFGTSTQAFHIGPATSATPGFMAGIRTLHERGARMSLVDLFSAAVRAARAGATMTPFQHYLARVVRPIVTATPASRQLFAPAGDLLAPGEQFLNPGLADALEDLAERSLEDSRVGQVLVDSQHGSGHLTTDDLRSYEVVERVPLSIEVGESTVHLNPLPAASGVLVAHSLRQLGRGITDPASIATALRSTNRARRASGGDLAMLDTVPQRSQGTTHISVLDADGAACAVTISNGTGNGEVVGDFGFMMNNILGEEDVNAEGPEYWPLNARLSSMMCPTIVEGPDGRLVALGSGGSSRIRSAVLQVVVGIAAAHEDVRHAVDAPRVHVEGEHLDFEDLLSPAERTELVERFDDHRVWPDRNLYFGGVHAAVRTADGSFSGAGDARRDGVSIVVD